jgi:hypothetical protein
VALSTIKIATLDLIFFADVAMKGFGGPKSSLRLLWLINEIRQFRSLLIVDNGHSTWPFFDDQPINTALIETVDPLSYATIGY